MATSALQDFSEAARLQAIICQLQQGQQEAAQSAAEYQQLAGAQGSGVELQLEQYRARRAAVLAAVEVLHGARQLRKVFLEGKVGAGEVRQRLAEAGQAG